MMKYLLICLALAGLSACVSKITRPDGTKVSESVYAYSLALDASNQAANQAATCDAAVTPAAGTPPPTTELDRAIEALRTIGGLAVCGQRLAGKGGAQVPNYQAPPTILDRVVQLAPLALGVGQLVASDRANARQTDASVLIAGIGAQRELGIVQAATGSNERISTGGFSAISQVAGAGLGALGDAAQSASAASVANSQAWAGALTSLPPTTQIIAGRDVIQARDVDQSTTGRNRITGDGNETERNVACNAQGGNGAPANAGNNSGAGGATSPLNASYNPLISGGAGAAGSNDCGNG